MFSCNAYILRFKIKEENFLHYQTSLGFFFLVLKFFLWHNKGMSKKKKKIYIYIYIWAKHVFLVRLNQVTLIFDFTK